MIEVLKKLLEVNTEILAELKNRQIDSNKLDKFPGMGAGGAPGRGKA